MSQTDPPRAYWDIDRIKAATDLVDLIGADIELKKTGQNYSARCPFHDEKTPSFTVSPDKQFYHCFSCGAHGDAIDWLTKYHRLPTRQAIEQLAGAAGITLDPIKDPVSQRKRRTVRERRAIEEALAHELRVLMSAVGNRVAYRAIPANVIQRYPHIQRVPDEPFEREYQAAERIRTALKILYGTGKGGDRG